MTIEALERARDCYNKMDKVGIRDDMKPFILGLIWCYLNELEGTLGRMIDFDKLHERLKRMTMGELELELLTGYNNWFRAGFHREENIKYLMGNVWKTPSVERLSAEELLGVVMSVWQCIWYNYREDYYDYLGFFLSVLCKGKESKNEVYTPDHIGGFLCEILGVDNSTVVLDPTCGTGALLLQAHKAQLKDCITCGDVCNTWDKVFGIECAWTGYELASLNMACQNGGVSNIWHGSCFDLDDKIKELRPDVILMNPPYNTHMADVPVDYRMEWGSGKGNEEPTKGLVFVRYISDLVREYNETHEVKWLPKLAVIVPTSAAIGNGKVLQGVRESLLRDNTLDAVFSLPESLFYPCASVSVVAMVFNMGVPHCDDNGEVKRETFFGYYKDDGFKNKKGLGRVEPPGWQAGISREWVYLYENKEVRDGKSALQKVKASDEWLCEAYMKTDYSKLTSKDFEQTVRNYVAYQIKSGKI